MSTRQYINKRPLFILLFIFIVNCLFICVGHTDTVKKDKNIMQYNIEFYPEDSKETKINPIVFSFNGKVYEEYLWFEDVTKKQLKQTEDEKFIISVVSKNQEGSEQDVLNLWHPDEREEIKSMVYDKNLFAKNQNFYHEIEHSAFMAKIYYGSYILFFIQHSGDIFGDFIKDYPVKKVDDSYFLTNSLQSDHIFTYFTALYKKKLHIKKKPE